MKNNVVVYSKNLFVNFKYTLEIFPKRRFFSYFIGIGNALENYISGDIFGMTAPILKLISYKRYCSSYSYFNILKSTNIR